MADNVLIATANDANGAHQKVVNEYLDANGLPVSVSATNPLPVEAVINTVGLATSVGQTAGNTSLSSINGKLPTGLTVTANRLQVELPLGVSGLTNTEIRATPLPVSISGGDNATATNQTTEIAKLTSIDGKTPALGQALAIASTPVVLTEVQLSALTPTPAISGFATSAKQDLLLSELQLKADLTETQPVSVTALPLPTGASTSANQQIDALTNTQLRANPIPVSITSDIQIGAVELKNATTDDRVAIINVTPTTEFGVVTRNIPSGTQAVSGTFFQAIQPVSAVTLPLPSGAATSANQQTNAITNTELRATALPVSLTSTTITGSVAVTGGLTDTQIRATALPISGSVSINNLNPAIETGLAKDATLTGGTQKAILRSGLKGTTVASDVTSTNIDVNTQALDVSVKGSVSVSNFPATQTITGTVTANTGLAQPLTNTEIRLTPLPISGTVSTGGLTDTQIRATPLPISGVVSANATLSAETTKVIGTVNVAGTIPISGSVTSNIGTTNGLALDSTLTGGTQKSVVRGGSKGTTVAADVTSTIIDVNTQALDVAVKNNVSVTGTFFQTTQPVSLTSTTVTNTVAVSATSLPLPTGAATAANQQTNAITDLQIRATPLPISGIVSTGGLTDTQIRATALPISGTVTTNIGTTNGLALDTSVNTLLKPASTLAAVTSITNAVIIKADTALNQTNALKVDGSATTQPISATTLPLPSGASTATLQGTGNTSLGSIDTKLPSGLTVTANRLLVELPAGGTGLTNTELRATAVPVSLTSTTITGTVATTALTDTQIRATPLPISGTVVTGGLTDTQLRATVLPVLNTADGDTTSTGTLALASQTVVLLMGGKSASSVSISGTWVGTITFEGTVDGTIFSPINAVATSTSQPQPTTTVNGLYRLSPAGLLQIRAIMTAYTSGTANISMRASTGTGGIFANQILPSKITDGTNTATIKPASTATTLTDLPLVVALHPTSPTPNFLVAQSILGTRPNAGTASVGGSTHLTVGGSDGTNLRPILLDTTGKVNVIGTFFQATQPISGTVVSTQSVASNLNMTEASASTILARTPALGQVTATSSTPVTQNIETASGTITTQNLVPTGSATAGSAVEIILAGSATLAIQTTGTYTGALSLQVTSDGANWVTVGGTPLININTGGYLVSITSALQSMFQADVTGFLKARITGLGAVTGTATITLRATANTSMVSLDAGLPAGTAVIGGVTQSGVWTAQIGNTPNTTAILSNPLTPAVSVTGDTGAKTVTGNGATQTNTTAKGAHIIINMGAVTGTTPTFIVKLQGSADNGTTWYDLPSATTATLVATGVFGIMIYPGLSSVAGTTVTGTTAQVSSSLPRSWRLFWTIGGTTPSFSITNIQVSYLI